MKVLLVDERFFDFNLLRNCVGDGICSLLDVDMFVTGNEKSAPVQILDRSRINQLLMMHPSTYPVETSSR